MNWILQSFIATGAFTGMIVAITSQVKNGLSVQQTMLFLACTWLPIFGTWTWLDGYSQATIKTILIIILAGILSALGNWAQFNAAAKAPNAGLVFAVVSCQVALIAIMARIFFRSIITPMQILGMIICLIGVIIISLSK